MKILVRNLVRNVLWLGQYAFSAKNAFHYDTNPITNFYLAIFFNFWGFSVSF